MKKTLKKLRPALLVVLLMFVSCQQDDVYMNDSNALSKGSSRVISYKELQTMPKAVAMLENLKKKKRQKSVYNERYDFTVDTTSIALFEIGGYHSLTFSIIRNDIDENVVENLVLNWEPYEDYKCFLTKYTLTEEDREKIINNEDVDLKDKEALTFLNYFSAGSILKSTGAGGENEHIIVVNGKCYKLMPVRVNSTRNAQGQLEASEWRYVWTSIPCPEEFLDNSYTEGNHPNGTGGATYTPVFNTPYPVTDFPVTIDPGSGGGSYGPIDGGSPYNPIYTKPKVDIALAHPRECEKIKEALDRENFRQEVVDLAGKVNDPVNEQGVGLNYYNTVVTFPPGPEIEVPVPISTPMFSNGYIVVSHTHNVNKLSVFSFSDFEAIAKLLVLNKINTNSFVATLSTQKGTHYALTINNATKFKDFFYHKFHVFANLTGPDIYTYKRSVEASENLDKKYYRGDNPLISVDNYNNELVLIQFLEFLKEADIGVALFEADAAFQNFQQLSLKRDGSIQRSTCP